MATHFEPGRGTATKKIKGKKVKGGYCFDFWLFGQRHHLRRGFDRKADSEDAERALRRRLQLEHAGVVVPPAATTSPRFANWAGVYSQWVHAQAAQGFIKRPDIIDANISSVLRFWGERPTDDTRYVHPTGPYRDLTLEDPIRDPSLVRAFDEWMTAEGLAPGTRNHYNTTMRQLYRLAMKPEYHDASGAPRYNPFSDRPRSKWKPRTQVLSVDDVQRWIQHASYHVRLVLAIGTLNAKFRLQNILQLEWSDVDFANRLITVWDHKTDRRGTALVAAMPAQLEAILDDARKRHPHATRVILYRGRPVSNIDEALRSAAIAAGLTWGRRDGVTFHSIRHFASTQMAKMQIPADLRKQVTGHADLKMELWYTHLFPEDERQHAEALSGAVPIAAHVTAGPTRVTRPPELRTPRRSRPGGAATPRDPGFSSGVGGRADVGGTAGGTVTANQALSVPVRPFPGLLRRPPTREERLAKIQGNK